MANIYQEDLDGFLAVADELQLKGLAGSENETLDAIPEPIKKPLIGKHKRGNITKQENINNEFQSKKTLNCLVPMSVGKTPLTVDPSVEDYKTKVDSLLEGDTEGEYRCTVCGKTNNGEQAKKVIRQHIETHLEGVSHPCDQCEKVTRTTHGLRLHVQKHH